MKKIICCAAVSMAVLATASGCRKETPQGQSGGAATPAAHPPAVAVLSIAADGGLMLNNKAVKIDSLEADLAAMAKASKGGLKADISFVQANANTFGQLEPVVQACLKAKVARATIGKLPYGLAAGAKPTAPVAQGVLPIRIAKKEDLDSIAQTTKAALAGKVVAVKCSTATKISLLNAVLKTIMMSEANFVFLPSDPAVGEGVEIQPAPSEM